MYKLVAHQYLLTCDKAGCHHQITILIQNIGFLTASAEEIAIAGKELSWTVMEKDGETIIHCPEHGRK